VPVMAWQGVGYVLAGSIVLVTLVRAPKGERATSTTS
jgi:hypothetical protein